MNPFSFDKDNKTTMLPNPLSMPMPMMHFSMNNNILNDDDWRKIYNTTVERNFNAFDKMNVVFKTSRGLRINIIIDPDKTISDLIRIFFMRVDREELFQRNDIIFIYNAQKLEYNDNTRVRDYFRIYFHPVIMANDLRDLIGA